MKHTRIFLIAMSFLLFSCKKENNVISEWDYSKRVEGINPLSSVQVFLTPSFTNANRYLIEGVKDGVKTSLIATVVGDKITVREMDGTLIFNHVRDVEMKTTSPSNLARLTLTCQQDQRRLCYNSKTCSIAYTLGWVVMEGIFAVNCSFGKYKL